MKAKALSFSAVAETPPSSTQALLNAFSSPCAIVNSVGTVLHGNAALSRHIHLNAGDDICSLLTGSRDCSEFLRTMLRNRSVNHYSCTPAAAISEFFISSTRIEGSQRRWLIELQSQQQRSSKFAALTRRRKETIDQRKENFRLSNEVTAAQSLAHIDPLTNIANRRTFDEELIAHCERAYRERSWLSVVMLDIDNFKQINDKLGHAKGDEILQLVAGSLASLCQRDGDICARYGGEEFVFIFPQVDIAGARHLACQAVAAVEALAIPHPESSVSTVVTISAGVHSMKPVNSDPETTAEQLSDAADSALYRAKAAGRNCTVHFDSGLVVNPVTMSLHTPLTETAMQRS